MNIMRSRFHTLIAQVYDRVESYAAGGRAFSGDMFWTLAAAEYPDYDGFAISVDPEATSLLNRDGESRPLNRFAVLAHPVLAHPEPSLEVHTV